MFVFLKEEGEECEQVGINLIHFHQEVLGTGEKVVSEAIAHDKFKDLGRDQWLLRWVQGECQLRDGVI